MPWRHIAVGTGHDYIVDANGKKIASLLGTFKQRDANAAAILMAADMLRIAKNLVTTKAGG